MFRLGLTLRDLEGSPEKQSELKKDIYDKFDIKGLHIAQLVQNGLFNWYVSSLLERGVSNEKLTKEIKQLFDNIEQGVYFVQQDDDITKKAKEIYTKINVNSPLTFIISSLKSATDCCDQIKILVMEEISGYNCELIESKNKKIYLLIRSLPSFESN